jgi:hypothetical protein
MGELMIEDMRNAIEDGPTLSFFFRFRGFCDSGGCAVRRREVL